MRELEVFVPNETLDESFIGRAVRTFREVGVRDISVVSCQNNNMTFRVLLDEEIDETALLGDDYVVNFQQLAETNPEYLLVVELPSPFANQCNQCPVTLVCGHQLSIQDGGLKLSIIAEQSLIKEVGARIRNSDQGYEVLRVREYDGTVNDASTALTARQRDIIMHAYEEGYYETPRETTLSELAAELGIDESTVAEHLQRAEKNVLEYALFSNE